MSSPPELPPTEPSPALPVTVSSSAAADARNATVSRTTLIVLVLLACIALLSSFLLWQKLTGIQEQLARQGLTVDDIYRRHEEFFGLHDVAERMLDFDERMQLFRFHHLKLAQRIIGGGAIGTMGTPVEVLQQRMQHVAYRELWDVRNRITANLNMPR